MKFFLFLTCILVSGLSGRAQQKVANVDKDDVSPLAGPFFVLGGEPYSLVKYVKVVDGSPFFKDEWMPAVLVLPGGTRYDSLNLKLDLLANEVHYQDMKGNELIATNPVREIWLHENSTGAVHHFFHSSFFDPGMNATPGWYELLADGNTRLFKHIVKQVTEIRPYSSATMEQRISSTPRYLVLHEKTLTPLKTISSFPDLFPAQKGLLEQYISSHKLKGKSDQDYITLLNYYNNLSPR